MHDCAASANKNCEMFETTVRVRTRKSSDIGQFLDVRSSWELLLLLARVLNPMLLRNEWTMSNLHIVWWHVQQVSDTGRVPPYDMSNTSGETKLFKWGGL